MRKHIIEIIMNDDTMREHMFEHAYDIECDDDECDDAIACEIMRIMQDETT